MSSPTSRSLEYLRKHGGMADVVERRIPHTPITKDLFGFIDIVAAMPDGILAVQTTAYAHHSNRCRKILYQCQEQARRWLSSGGLIEVHSWRAHHYQTTRETPAENKTWFVRRSAIQLEGDELIPREILDPDQEAMRPRLLTSRQWKAATKALEGG